MTTVPMPSLDSFKLETTFHDNLVIHKRAGLADQVWAKLSVLGKGGQGTVYLQQLETGPTRLLRAVKELSVDQRASSNAHVMRELNMMMAVRDHEELFVNLFGWFEDLQGTVFLAMEYLPHGDLGEYIKATSDAQRDAREVTRQLLTGLSVLHNLNICHRDLKPQNVLIASLNPIKVKLADFGISKSTAGTDLRTRIGTTHYMGPELLGVLPRDLRQGNEYTTAVDMWALGFIVHELLTGVTPFLETPVDTVSSGYPTYETGQTTTDMRLLMQFCDGHAVLPLEMLQAVDAPTPAVGFIRSLVVADPRSRATATQALLDPWITGVPHQVVTRPQAVTPERIGSRSKYSEPTLDELTFPLYLPPDVRGGQDVSAWLTPQRRTRTMGEIIAGVQPHLANYHAMLPQPRRTGETKKEKFRSEFEGLMGKKNGGGGSW